MITIHKTCGHHERSPQSRHCRSQWSTARPHDVDGEERALRTREQAGDEHSAMRHDKMGLDQIRKKKTNAWKKARRGGINKTNIVIKIFVLPDSVMD
jgi:hypothetical protein